MNDKFNTTYQNVLKTYQVNESTHASKIPDNREQTGGLLPGDRIKFTDNILSSEWYKNQNPQTQHIVQELHDGDLNIFVDKLTSNLGEDGRGFEVVVSRELAPGFMDPAKVSIPSQLCEFLATGGDRATSPVPDSWRGPERVTLKPEPVAPYPTMDEEVDDQREQQTKKSDDGSGKLIDGDREFTDKNVPGQKGGTYTQNYMPNS